MIFPPIFALVIFGILDFIELVFDITGFGSPVGVFLSFLSTLLYFIQVFMRYGWKKMVEKLFKYKGIPKKKAAKKVMKVFGNSFIPFVTTWAVWDDYQEEKREKAGKGEGGEESEESKKSKLLKGAALAAATVATGGTAGAAAAGARVAAGRAAAGTASRAAAGAGARTSATKGVAGDVVGGTTAGAASRSNVTSLVTRTTTTDMTREVATETTETITKKEVTKKAAGKPKAKVTDINPWIKTKTKVGGKEEKTIAEEVSGIKTGLSSQEDYTEGLPDFSRPETYDNLLREREENKKKDEQKRKEIEETRLIQKQREKVEAEKVFDRAFIRRFGTQAYERMVRDRELRKGKGRKIPGKDSDKYRESA